MDNNIKIETSKKTAIVAGAFCLLIGTMLILNYWQMTASNPLESKTLENLVFRLASEPGNEELMLEIRELDLLARKAYFTSLWQVKTGGYLLLLAAIILVLALRTYYSLTAGIEIPAGEDEDDIRGREASRRWIIGGTGVLIVVALIAAFSVTDPLRDYSPEDDTKETTEVIRQIAISDAVISDTTMPASPDPITGTEPEIASEIASEIVAAAPPVFPGEAEIMQNHNAFRGPWSNGVIYHNNVPLEWDGESGTNILWKVPVPLHAYSSPVVWGDKLFITGADNETRKVFCFNSNTGAILWERAVDNIPGSPATPPQTTEDTGLGAPSVTTDGIGVYAIFGTGDIAAFDMNGNRLWVRHLGVHDNHYGYSSSPISHGEKLFIQYDDRNQGRIICLNVLSGETIWDITRESDISWASPILIKTNGSYQLVVAGNPIVAGYDIESGRELWKAEAMSGEVGPSPAWGGGLVYAANEYARMVAIEPGSGRIVWENNYYLPEVSSPVYADGLLFIATTYALIACFDAKTGDFLWEYDTDDIFYSSPVIAGDRLYITDTGGVTYIMQVNREPAIIARNSLGEHVHTTPAFKDGKIYIRGERNLYCITE